MPGWRNTNAPSRSTLSCRLMSVAKMAPRKSLRKGARSAHARPSSTPWRQSMSKPTHAEWFSSGDRSLKRSAFSDTRFTSSESGENEHCKI